MKGVASKASTSSAMDESRAHLTGAAGMLTAISKPSESEVVLHRVNDTAVSYPENALLHELFEAQVARSPDAVAVTVGASELTYGQLNSRANQVAHSLLAAGVRADDRVGIFAERSVEMVVSMLGILKAGGAYVPLDPSYPAERLEFITKDSALTAIVTTEGLQSRLQCSEIPRVVVGKNPPQSEENPAVMGLTARNLAYVIYTSGSTGRPKGVLIEHRSVLRLVIGGTYVRIQPDDCMAHCASPSFDAATWEVWAALLNGSRLLVVPQHALLSPMLFNQILVRHAVTLMWLTAGLFAEYVDALEQAFGGLRYLLTGGDVVVPSIAARALSKPARPEHLINGYGPTETTTFATTFEITETAARAPALPIGRPISNTQIYIVDENRAPVPIGVTGEIYIGGPGLARGYLNHPEQTADRFTADPFREVSGARLYRTGDLGQWTPDGNVEFVGRGDSQIKIRGFRAEPREVEVILQRHPGVKQALVMAREDELGQKRLVAYVVTDSGPLRAGHLEEGGREMASDTAKEVTPSLRDFLAQALPHYMVPAAILVLDEFPLTSNGKVDRNALPARFAQQRPRETLKPARTPLEATLAGIWTQVLNQQEVGVTDNFFELGGDSIMGLELIEKVSDTLNLHDLSVVSLFENPTVREMAEFVAPMASDVRGVD